MCTENINLQIFTNFGQNTAEFYDNYILYICLRECGLRPRYFALNSTENGKDFLNIVLTPLPIRYEILLTVSGHYFLKPFRWMQFKLRDFNRNSDKNIQIVVKRI